MNHSARGRQKHLALLCCLLLLFVVSPFVTPLRYGVLFLNMIGAAVLLSGTYTINPRKKLFLISVVLAVIAVVIICVIVFYRNERLVLLSDTCILVLLTLFSVSILGEVLRAGRITADKIYGAICVYLLIGYAWAFAYAILERLQPGSFTVPDETVIGSGYVATVMRMRYFSFVTLTTVGFGDILPRSPAALAVLVARLVGLHIVHGSKSEPDDDSK